MSIQLSLVIFTALVGTAGWLAVCIAISELSGKGKSARSLAAIATLVLAIVGGIASVTHLSHPDRLFGALGHPTSGIFIEAVLVGLLIVSVVVYLILLKRESGAAKVLAIIAAIIGLVGSYMTGNSYIMSSIPVWDTVTLPIAYSLTVAPAGVALYLVLLGIKKDQDAKLFGLFLAVVGILGAIGAAAFLAPAGADALLTWGVCVVVGGIIPAICGFLVFKGQSAMIMGAIALACALVGCVALRCLMWTTGETLYSLFGTTI